MKGEWFTIEISDEWMMEFYGVDTMEEVRAIEAEQKKLMCSCDGDTDAYYVPDGKSKVCDKHHWVCHECDKIKQIG